MVLSGIVVLGKVGAQKYQRYSVELWCSRRLELGNTNSTQRNYGAQEYQWYSMEL